MGRQKGKWSGIEGLVITIVSERHFFTLNTPTKSQTYDKAYVVNSINLKVGKVELLALKT